MLEMPLSDIDYEIALHQAQMLLAEAEARMMEIMAHPRVFMQPSKEEEFMGIEKVIRATLRIE